jgi:hypothetical protein
VLDTADSDMYSDGDNVNALLDRIYLSMNCTVIQLFKNLVYGT